ncbi:hypothetical protein BSF41_40520 [Flavobacterium sp. ACN2]|jgi:hypothetical protein|uniref:hypothetical protein n=1 Tax=Flavobacterium sp. ACN2 TaxID=1975676 RepID=UPI000BB3BF4F|nr:hypothetical protein [Flavobacterium sp. ACN2]PBI84724.1 hypothetical protein BSF41_40520 [Flavobacterium sp. ACN2]
MLPPNFKDIATKGPYRIHETDSFIKLEIQSNGVARASLIDEAGDIIMQGGSLNGKSLDPLGIKFDLPQKMAQQQDINRFYNNWLGVYVPDQKSSGFLGSIHTHYEKIYLPKNGKPALDYIVIDYKHFDEISIVIGQQPTYLKNQIDQFVIQNFNQYTNQLIKLNY